MARRGLGGSLSYSKDGRRNVFRFRCGGISHGIVAVYDESQARTRRAMYPHRLSTAGFSVTVILNGYTEYRTFMGWMAAYAEHLLDEDRAGGLPVMTVAVPGKRFLRLGVPTTGISFGDHVGSMVWEPVIGFESANDPLERNPVPALSYYKDIVARSDQNVRYFYPFSEQLAGDEKPSVYDTVIPGSAVIEATSPSAASPAEPFVPMGTDSGAAPSGRGSTTAWGD